MRHAAGVAHHGLVAVIKFKSFNPLEGFTIRINGGKKIRADVVLDAGQQATVVTPDPVPNPAECSPSVNKGLQDEVPGSYACHPHFDSTSNLPADGKPPKCPMDAIRSELTALHIKQQQHVLGMLASIIEHEKKQLEEQISKAKSPPKKRRLVCAAECQPRMPGRKLR